MEPSEMSRLTRTVFRRMRLPMTEPSDFQSALARHADTLGVLLANLLDTRPLDGEIARPDHLMAAMRHGALHVGKRLRPFLFVETARLFDKTGEAVKVFCVRKDADLSVEEVIAYCRANMAGYKIPRTVIFGPLPKTSTGKIQKFVLRDRATGKPD